MEESTAESTVESTVEVMMGGDAVDLMAEVNRAEFSVEDCMEEERKEVKMEEVLWAEEAGGEMVE